MFKALRSLFEFSTQKARSPRRRTKQPHGDHAEALESRLFLSAGDLDPSFGIGGKAVEGWFSNLVFQDMAVQGDGKIVMVGIANVGSYYNPNNDFVVERYHADGTPDLSFGLNGILTIPVGIYHDHARAVSIQSDGKILIAGQFFFDMQPGSPGYEVNSDIAVIRLNSNGSLDLSFGTNGVATFGITPFYLNPSYKGTDDVFDMMLQEDGKIILACESVLNIELTGYRPRFAVVRLNQDGSLDTSFGSNGLVGTKFSLNDYPTTLALQDDGKILVGGYTATPSVFGGQEYAFALSRYNPDGTLDNTFDGDGLVTITMNLQDPISYMEIHGISVQSDGKIVVAGRAFPLGSSVGFGVVRFNADGSLDSTFGGGDGKVLTVFDSSGRTYAYAEAIVIQSDGKLLVCGSHTSSLGATVVRYNPDGSIDTSFGDNGMRTYPMGTARRIAVLQNGSILIAGQYFGLFKLLGDTPTYNPQLYAPTLFGGSSVVFNKDQASAIVVNPNVLVDDEDNTTLASATVGIVANYLASEDVLDFVGNASTGNITGSFNPTLGTLTLTSAGATATVGQFQAALRLVTYRNASANPSLLPRSIAYQVSDGSNLSNILTSTVNVTSSNDAPTLVGTSSLIYKERQIAAIVNSVLAVGDLDHATLSSATVRISANYIAGEDVLEFVGTTTTGNITGSFDAVSGTLTLQSAGSTATLAQFQAALRLVKYSNASFNPTSAVRTVSYQVSDGTVSSNVMTSLITVVPANNSPTVSGTSVLAYTEKGAAQVINPSIVVADVDNSLVSATVRISANNSSSQDVLGFVGDATTGDITGSFSGGFLTLISPGGTATVAQFQAALRRVTYVNTSANPSTLPRSVTYQVSDGTILSTAVTSTINITSVNDAPTLVGASTLIYTPNQVATAVNKTVVVADADNTTLSSATVRISSNYVAAEDRLGFVGTTTTGNIVGSFNAATGTMTLTSAGATATIAQFMAAIRLVTYQNISATPTTAPRSIQYQVSDTTLSSNPVTSLVTIKGTGTGPVVGGQATTLSYSEKQAATVVNSTVTVSDADSTTLAWATVRILANLKATEDILGFVGDASTGNITGSYSPSTGTLTLISEGATATVGQFQAALRLVTYRNASANPSLLPRSVGYQLSDGSNLSNILTSTVTINS